MNTVSTFPAQLPPAASTGKQANQDLRARAMLARKHAREKARIKLLKSLGILDTPQEVAFDEIVDLASKICNTPISLVTLVDSDRQFFKAHHGTDINQTSLVESICAHTILDDGITVIPDTTSDPRTAHNPLNKIERLRFYAGVPLVLSDGLPIGSLCVLDRMPRDLTEFQREALRVLGTQVTAQLELRRALAVEKSQAESLRKALETQEILAREIDHRVKNSLQIVSSLMRLQASRHTEEPVRAALTEARHRIAAIAAIHGELHRSAVQADVNLATYFSNLARHFSSAFPETITFKVNVVPLVVPTAIATGLAVIANEFVSNSLKHAFPDDTSGTIALRVWSTKTGFSMSMSDNGRGIATGDDPERGMGLGQQIMTVSAEQIGATMTRPKTGTGTAIRLDVPLSSSMRD